MTEISFTLPLPLPVVLMLGLAILLILISFIYALTKASFKGIVVGLIVVALIGGFIFLAATAISGNFNQSSLPACMSDCTYCTIMAIAMLIVLVVVALKSLKYLAVPLLIYFSWPYAASFITRFMQEFPVFSALAILVLAGYAALIVMSQADRLKA